MELTVEAPKRIEDGKHEGVIIDVEERTKPYKYTDLVIKFDDGIHTIKYGLSSTVTVQSQLGKLLMEFGAALEEGQLIDVTRIFKNQACTFMTLTDSGGFAKVIKGSVKAK